MYKPHRKPKIKLPFHQCPDLVQSERSSADGDSCQTQTLTAGKIPMRNKTLGSGIAHPDPGKKLLSWIVSHYKMFKSCLRLKTRTSVTGNSAWQ